jgi:O-antigen/teichoic acid export membrane protein
MREAHGAVYLTIATIMFIVSGYFTNIILGRHFGPELYGIYGVLTSLMTALNIMQVSGVPQSVSKFSAEKHDQSESILKSGLEIQLVMTVTIGLIFYLSAPLIANIFNDPRFIGYARALALIFPFYGIFALYSGYYNGLHYFKRQSLMNGTYAISKLILVLTLAINFGLYGAITGFVLSPLIALAFGFKLPKTHKIFPRKILIIYSIPLITFALLATLQLTIDLFTLKAIVSDNKIVGFYTAAQNIAIIPYLCMSAVGQVLFPSISRFMGAGQIFEAQKAIEKSIRYLLLLLLPMTALLITTAPSLVQLLYGRKYLPAVTPLRILLIGYVMLAVFALLANALNGAGNAKISMIIAGSGLSLGFLSCLILIPLFGANGAAIGTLIGACISAIGAIIATHKAIEFHFSLNSFLKILVASMFILMGGLLFSLPVQFLPLIYVFLTIFYVLTLHKMGEITLEDRMYIKKLLPDWVPFARLL